MSRKILCLLLSAGMLLTSACAKRQERSAVTQPVSYVEEESYSPGGEASQEPEEPQVLPQKGDIVVFGSWEQNGEAADGPEQIRWIVLSAGGNELTLFSEYCLDTVPFNEEQTRVTWETCTLRSWLNNDFYRDAFSEEERQLILLSHQSFWNNDYYGTDGGNDTDDYVFLLGADAQETMYQADAGARFAVATRHAYLTGCETGQYTGYATYWIAGAAANKEYALYVDAMGTYYDGGTDAWGAEVSSRDIGVRPCIRIRADGGLPENTANVYQTDAEETKAFRNEFENILYNLPYEFTIEEMDAPGYASFDEAAKALADVLGTRDVRQFFARIPWPQLYQEYGVRYLKKIANRDDWAPGERYRKMTAFAGSSSKEVMIRTLLDEPVTAEFAAPYMKNAGYTFTRYGIFPWEGTKDLWWEGSGSSWASMSKDIAGLFPGCEIRGFIVWPGELKDSFDPYTAPVLPRDENYNPVYCYAVLQDGLWYAGAISGAEVYLP
ncbi:MAG: hypothetical protein IJH99_07850 [Eubacterium sp.]|nr:hypothetical protein [Eubacterium sp.]